MKTNTIIFLLFCSGSMGCATYRSQLLDRDATNTRWEDTPTGGIPITVKVPTDVEIRIVERLYYKDGNPFTVSTCYDACCPLKSIHVAHTLVETERVFTIDPKRPPAGLAHSTIDFEGQYPKEMKSDITDETIQRVGDLVLAANKTFGIGLGRGANDSTGAKTGGQELDLFLVDRVVAVQRFNLDAADLELQIQEFLNAKLNHCCSDQSLARLQN